ncbi:MAG TPA: hypothetical protein [Caudoviricetes sp.]|nr:MAG TPA: hypothetical protein [Caudoviricetes sp.]
MLHGDIVDDFNHLSHFLYILYHKNFFMSTCRRGEVIRRAMKIFVL